jgi:hypothetical protein
MKVLLYTVFKDRALAGALLKGTTENAPEESDFIDRVERKRRTRR